jgi:hypothetical protein
LDQIGEGTLYQDRDKKEQTAQLGGELSRLKGEIAAVGDFGWGGASPLGPFLVEAAW